MIATASELVVSVGCGSPNGIYRVFTKDDGTNNLNPFKGVWVMFGSKKYPWLNDHAPEVKMPNESPLNGYFREKTYF